MKKVEPRANVDAGDDPGTELQEVVTDKSGQRQKGKLNNATTLQEEQPTTHCSNSTSSNKELVMCQRIRRCDYLIIRKILGCLIVVVLTVVCLWHTVGRIRYYWSEPTSFQIIVDRVPYVQFPAITICPAREPFKDDDWNQAFQSSNFSDSPKAKFSLEDIWNEYAITKEHVTVLAACNEKNLCNATHGFELALKSSVLDTILGRCITLSQGVPVKYRGDLTFWQIVLNNGRYGFEGEGFGQPSAVEFFIHDSQAVHRHEANFLVDSIDPDKLFEIQLTLTQYDFQNLSRSLCYSQAEVNDCKNKCVDDGLDQILNCSLPFMKSKLPTCITVSEAKQAFDRAHEFYSTFDWSECSCKRQCQDNKYTLHKQMIKTIEGNQTIVHVEFGDNLIEKVYEEYAYSFSALVSDIGGSVGIFLGLSIYSFFNFLDKYLLEGVKKEE